MRTLFQVAGHLKSAGTRGRGVQFFPILRDAVRRTQSDAKIVISFEGVEFVSTSFLEETVLRLLAEDHDIADRLIIEDLQPLVSERLRSKLSQMSKDPAIVSSGRTLEPV